MLPPEAFLGHEIPTDLYVNVATRRNPAGELRGQISAVPEPGTGFVWAGLGVISLLWSRRRNS